MSPSTSVSLESTSNNVWDASSGSAYRLPRGLSLTLAISTAISVVWELTDDLGTILARVPHVRVSCRRLAPFAFATGTRETSVSRNLKWSVRERPGSRQKV